MDYKIETIRPANTAKDNANATNVLIIYTGGTLGMLHLNNDPKAQLVPGSWDEIKERFSILKKLPFGIRVAIVNPPIDSSNVNPKHWGGIAKIIRDNYHEYDGFVVLHGTDTMAYTASALSFLLENLAKPVIFTGAQLPIADPRNDAAQNLVTALMIAASYNAPTVPEVCILFDNVLLRGNRSQKISVNGFAGFDSLNCRPLAEIGTDIKVNRELIRGANTGKFFINETVFDENVTVVNIFPGIKPEALRHIFNIEGLRGVILQTYGAGNVPTDDKAEDGGPLLKEICAAIKEKGIVFVNITQCRCGTVEMDVYGTGVKLKEIGVVGGGDMTNEAALVKMMFLLGKYPNPKDLETVKEQMKKNLRGELSC